MGWDGWIPQLYYRLPALVETELFVLFRLVCHESGRLGFTLGYFSVVLYCFRDNFIISCMFRIGNWMRILDLIALGLKNVNEILFEYDSEKKGVI